MVELDVYNCLNCFINSKCRDEQVGGIDRIPQSNYIVSYCYIWTVDVIYGKPVEWNCLDEFDWMIFNIMLLIDI